MMKLSELLKECGIEERTGIDWEMGDMQWNHQCEGYNKALKEIGDLEIDENKFKNVCIELVEEYFPKGTEGRGKATVIVALLLSQLPNIITLREG